MKLFFRIIAGLVIFAAVLILALNTKDALDTGRLDIGNLTRVIPKDTHKTPEEQAREAAAAKAAQTEQARQAAAQALANMKTQLEGICLKHQVELSEFQPLGGAKYRIKFTWRGDVATWGGDVLEDGIHAGIIGGDFETLAQKSFRNQFGKTVYTMELKLTGPG